MASKPKPNKEVAVRYTNRDSYHICIESSQDALSDFEDFGKLRHIERDIYNLTVSARYDFDEVLAYIESYG